MRQNFSAVFVGLLLVVVAVLMTTVIAIRKIDAKQGCFGHLELAANANTVELAEKELGTALNYIEARGWTSGYTSVIYRTEDENVGFWYNNLKSAHEELLTLSDDSSPLEKTNVLMKLRESLIVNKEHGDVISKPVGILYYPNNLGWGIYRAILIILFILGGVIIFACAED